MKSQVLATPSPVSPPVILAESSAEQTNWRVWSVVLFLLSLLLYWAVLKALAEDWWSDPDYGHGVFVPLFSAYILWHDRQRWLKTAIRPSNFGLLIMLAAISLLLIGDLGAELFTARFSFLVILAGMIVFLAGWKMLRSVLFPLAFLVFMIPIPEIVYNQITFPLQLLASRLATFCLQLLQIPVLRDGNILVTSNYSLAVVEACSGIRSLMSLLALAAAYGYLAEPSRRVRLVLAFLMIPIALITNAIRITVAGVMAHLFGPSAAEGFLHEFSGWIIFLSAILLMFLCHRMLRLFVAPLNRETVA
ncbi:MAG: exosortase A [Candidatus Acidiferrum sp.]